MRSLDLLCDSPRTLRLCVRLICLLVFCPELRAAEPKWQTGPKFRAAIDAPFAAAWKSIELREVLRQVQQETGVAILLDRRIDPTAMPEIKFTGNSLREGLSDLAASVGAEISTPENVVYIGPPEACRKLRTLIGLRTGELSPRDPDSKSWLKPKTIRWDDLAEPREILAPLINSGKQTAGPGGGLQVSNPEAVEHDLWAAAELPAVSSIAALSLVLIQFDLTFEWDNGGNIKLVPIPAVVQIEREHTLKGKSPSDTFIAWKARWPQLKFDRRTDRQVKVLATVEEHEEIAGGPAKRGPKGAGTLTNEEFSLKIKDVSIHDLMKELEKSGVQFDYDADELKQAGVDLDRFIELDAKKLPAAKFFETIFSPLGVKSEIVGNKVKLTPK